MQGLQDVKELVALLAADSAVLKTVLAIKTAA
jgi:hypothetical protein